MPHDNFSFFLEFEHCEILLGAVYILIFGLNWIGFQSLAHLTANWIELVISIHFHGLNSLAWSHSKQNSQKPSKSSWLHRYAAIPKRWRPQPAEGSPSATHRGREVHSAAVFYLAGTAPAPQSLHCPCKPWWPR
jgi:hypothetical protein